MSKVTDTLFGGTDNSSQKRQLAQNEQAKELIAEQAGIARGDIMNLYPAADASRNMGFQAALDIMGQAAPQQFGAFQQGNVGAQQALLSGLPQMQNAIMGIPTDLSGLQPQTIDYSTDFAQQQLPQFQSSSSALESGENTRMAELLSGITNNADLFRAASTGGIPNISEGDQDFWRRHLANVQGQGGAQFVNNPTGSLAGVVGQPGGFNPKNEQRLAHLLGQYQTMQS